MTERFRIRWMALGAGLLMMTGFSLTIGTGVALMSCGSGGQNGSSTTADSAINPCVAKVQGSNPCASKALNPCAAKTLNPCAAKGMNPCDAKALNPCGGHAASNPCNPCGGASAVNPCKVKQPAGVVLAGGRQAALVSAGKALWNDRGLGKNGLACASCHVDNYGQMNASFARPYPHAVAMPRQQAGLAEVNAAEMVQFCMVVPMAADPLPWRSTELAALTAYVESLQPGFAPTANPCGAKNACNPCAVKNPCNPCAGRP